MKRASLALVAVTIFTVVATSLYSQDHRRIKLRVLCVPELMRRWLCCSA
jgi:hypothetical protein